MSACPVSLSLARLTRVQVVCVTVADAFVALGERERAQQVLDSVLARRARDPRVQPSLAQVRARVLSGTIPPPLRARTHAHTSLISHLPLSPSPTAR